MYVDSFCQAAQNEKLQNKPGELISEITKGHFHGVTNAKNWVIYDHWSYMTLLCTHSVLHNCSLFVKKYT